MLPNHWDADVDILRKLATDISGVMPPASGGEAIGCKESPFGQEQPRTRADEYYEPPAAGEEQERDKLICDILSKMISQSLTGWVNPSKIRRDWRLLRQYVPPGELQEFISAHKQFQIRTDSTGTWEFGFAERDQSAPASAQQPVSDGATTRTNTFSRANVCWTGEQQAVLGPSASSGGQRDVQGQSSAQHLILKQ